MHPHMERFVVPVLALWLCVAASIDSADAASSQGSAVLPAAIDGWTWDGQEAHDDARTVFDNIDGAGELFLAYGFERLAVRRFEKTGQPPLTIECYRMASAECAFFGEDRALDVTPHHIQVTDTEDHLGVSDLRRIEVVKLGWMEDVLI